MRFIRLFLFCLLCFLMFGMFSINIVESYLNSCRFLTPLVEVFEVMQLINVLLIASRFIKSFVDFKSNKAFIHPCSIVLMIVSLMSFAYCAECVIDIINLNFSESEKWGVLSFNNLFVGNKPFVELISEAYTVLAFAVLLSIFSIICSITLGGVDRNIVNGLCFSAFIFYSANVFSRILLVKETQATDIQIVANDNLLSIAFTVFNEFRKIRLMDIIRKYLSEKIKSYSVFKYSELNLFESGFKTIFCIFTLPITRNEWFDFKQKQSIQENSDSEQSRNEDELTDEEVIKIKLSRNLIRSLVILITTCYCLQMFSHLKSRYYSPVISYYTQMIVGTLYFMYKIQVSSC